MAYNKENITSGTDAGKRRIIPMGETGFALGRVNIIVMALSAVLIVLGFVLMAGGASSEMEFNPEMFNTRRIAVGPTIAFLGFVAMGIGIVLKPGRK